MKAYLKTDPNKQLGHVDVVYKTSWGQKRLTVFFGDEDKSFFSVDADASEFETVEESHTNRCESTEESK